MSVKPLRVRQAEATRSLLVAVARENFTEHGYAATSIDDIIQQAGVARGALYRAQHPRVAAAATQVVAERAPHVGIARARVAIEQRLGRDQNPGGAVTALRSLFGALDLESKLNVVKSLGTHDPKECICAGGGG